MGSYACRRSCIALGVIAVVGALHDYRVMTSGEIFVQNDRESCGIVIPSQILLSRVASMQGRGAFADKWHDVMTNEPSGICIEPGDTQDSDHTVYEEFRKAISSAELWASDKDNTLELVCQDSHGDMVVAYVFQSKYSGVTSLATKNPLPLKKSATGLKGIRQSLSALVSREKKQKLFILFRNMYLSTNPDKLMKPSFPAFQYCYEAYRRRQMMANIIAELSAPIGLSNSMI
jgi:hypothetical protein